MYMSSPHTCQLHTTNPHEHCICLFCVRRHNHSESLKSAQKSFIIHIFKHALQLGPTHAVMAFAPRAVCPCLPFRHCHVQHVNVCRFDANIPCIETTMSNLCRTRPPRRTFPCGSMSHHRGHPRIMPRCKLHTSHLERQEKTGQHSSMHYAALQMSLYRYSCHRHTTGHTPWTQQEHSVTAMMQAFWWYGVAALGPLT